ncbi:hypothetical protein SK128_026635 [Halocaridina rubra]|uniref:Brain protein I3 n=1 Tax=Halocaridina rubra TaxID=373956 RepID=A0AAN8X6Q4_HALRR
MPTKIVPVSPRAEGWADTSSIVSINLQYPDQKQQQWGLSTKPDNNRPRCQRCKEGYLEAEFSCCGILAAIALFPLGLICCCLFKVKVCTYCGKKVYC